MNRQQNVLDKRMSLHDIKDEMQLLFAQQHANFIFNNLETLIDNTYRLTQHAATGKPLPFVVHATTRKYRIKSIYLHRELEYVQKQNGLP